MASRTQGRKARQAMSRVLTLTPFHNPTLHDAWVDANQGTQYMSAPGVVAATDGSVGINQCRRTGDYGRRGSVPRRRSPPVARQIQGPPCSLLGEAAAML
eukprot:2976449-Rhodomonas_salina.1